MNLVLILNDILEEEEWRELWSIDPTHLYNPPLLPH